MVYIRYDDFEELHFLIALLEDTDLKGVVVYGSDMDVLWADFRAHFREIDAAGGVVRNEKGELLLIHRNGKWDLPKGKLEPEEDALEGALREVQEECGLNDLIAGGMLMDTYHTYSMEGLRYLKKTSWYTMKSSQTELIPQREEGIDKVLWENPARVDIASLSTYESIRDVLSNALGAH